VPARIPVGVSRGQPDADFFVNADIFGDGVPAPTGTQDVLALRSANDAPQESIFSRGKSGFLRVSFEVSWRLLRVDTPIPNP